MDFPTTFEYVDLRSAAKAKHRERRRMKKYNNFRTITEADLPLSLFQQTHCLPTCLDTSCPTYGTHDPCWLSQFPADFKTAPSAKFTKRGAWEEAQWSKPPTYKKSRDHMKYGLKWNRQKITKRNLREEFSRKEWKEDLSWFDTEDFLIEHCCHFPWNEDFCYPRLQEEDEAYWSEEDEQPVTVIGREESECWDEELVKWHWHKDKYSGEWCATRANYVTFVYDLNCREWEVEIEGEVDIVSKQDEDLPAYKEAESSAEEDWDIVSTATSAWTDLDKHFPSHPVDIQQNCPPCSAGFAH